MFSGRAATINSGYAELPTWPGLGLKLNEQEAAKHPRAEPNPSMYFEDGSVADY
jgi:L-alanine-DL-glutamate epimerase-like enolase superfamily enzyme